jgi:hypothetical protein
MPSSLPRQNRSEEVFSGGYIHCSYYQNYDEVSPHLRTRGHSESHKKVKNEKMHLKHVQAVSSQKREGCKNEHPNRMLTQGADGGKKGRKGHGKHQEGSGTKPRSLEKLGEIRLSKCYEGREKPFTSCDDD